MTAPVSFRPSDQVVLAELPDGTGVLLHLDTRLYYSLNRTALFVWKALAAGTDGTVPSLGRSLASVFEVEVDAAERDTAALLSTFAQERLVVG